MKVIINSNKRDRKEYTNLPEHDAARELLRSRIEQRSRQMPSDAGVPNAPTASFGPSAEDIKSPGTSSIEEAIPSEEADRDSWKTSRWVPAILVGAVLLFCAIWYLAAGHEQELMLQRVRVEGTSMLKESEIVALAGIDRSQKFYDIDLKRIQQRLLRHSLIKSAHPRRELNPATIVLEIEERHPVALARLTSSGEAVIIDADGVILRPRLMAGLRDQQKLLQVPLISGIPDNDTAAYRAMAQLVMMMQSLDTGALAGAIGELARTPTGALVIYTTETQTPIFIGSPGDQPFRTAIEVERGATVEPQHNEPHFVRQLHLLSKLWKTRLAPELRSGHVFYVDARFSGEVIVKRKPGYASRDTSRLVRPAPSLISSPPIAEHR